MSPLLAQTARLAHYALALGRVNRATAHEDGVRPETDTDHTVMLALVAPELAYQVGGVFQIYRVGAFAVVHDLVASKKAREEAAHELLREELGRMSWVMRTLDAYERQDTREARLVRLLDKLLPEVTHLFNGCSTARAHVDRAGFARSHREQLAKLTAEYPEPCFAPYLALLSEAMDASEAAWAMATPEENER